MIRVGLTAYLLVATLAGPAWCCCTFARVASTAFQAAVKKSSESSSHSCCSTKALQTTHESESKSKPGEPKKCPCKETRDVQSALFAATDGAEQYHESPTFDFRDFDGTTFLSSVPTQAVALFALCDLARIHFSGRDILVAFQTFRC
ncbi:MAG: hypothetical protein K2X38_18510 [Gemmataceae bacterium]|nr:hypothetical protein [Gemmataceae bacterium]